MSELYIGVMSGTSLDGVDVCLCEIDSFTCKALASIEYEFDAKLKSDILHVIESKTALKEIGIIDKKLALLYVDAIDALIEKESIDTAHISAIGMHGQTVWHEPKGEFAFSMQLGDANTLSFKTGIKVVSDFRRADMARGGQGAPFAPAFHQFVFNDKSKKTAVLNLGGMANITILQESITGYDTGPANVLMDYWIHRCKNRAYDRDGEWAKSGKISKELLKKMLKDEYFKRSYPKSTGRELFNSTWLKKMIEGFSLKDEDIQATLLALSVESISDELKKFDIQKLILCGGGAKNGYLVESLQSLLGDVELHVSKDSDRLEAMAFAWLAYKRIHREEVDLMRVTGASENAILGAVYG
jgi:anhydro-N-acetylmuramic acid kinase